MCVFNFITLKTYKVLHFCILSPYVLKYANQRCSVCEGQADKSRIQFCRTHYGIKIPFCSERVCNSALTCFRHVYSHLGRQSSKERKGIRLHPTEQLITVIRLLVGVQLAFANKRLDEHFDLILMCSYPLYVR